VSEPVIKLTLNLPIYQLAKRPKIVDFFALKYSKEYYFIKIPKNMAKKGKLKNNNLIK